MVPYLLDTNILSDAIGNPHGACAGRMQSESAASLCTSIVVAAELGFAIAKKAAPELSRRVNQLLDALDILSLGPGTDLHYAILRCALERQGAPIGANDMLIAAHALASVDSKASFLCQVHDGRPISNPLYSLFFGNGTQEHPMFAGTPQESLPVVDDCHVSELSGQITRLRELIIVMVDLQMDTRRQSELLFRLLREFRAAKPAQSAAPDGQAQKLASRHGATRAQLDA